MLGSGCGVCFFFQFFSFDVLKFLVFEFLKIKKLTSLSPPRKAYLLLKLQTFQKVRCARGCVGVVCRCGCGVWERGRVVRVCVGMRVCGRRCCVWMWVFILFFVFSKV